MPPPQIGPDDKLSLILEKLILEVLNSHGLLQLQISVPLQELLNCASNKKYTQTVSRQGQRVHRSPAIRISLSPVKPEQVRSVCSGSGGAVGCSSCWRTQPPQPPSAPRPHQTSNRPLRALQTEGCERQDRALRYITGHTGMVPDINQELFRIV